MEKAKKSVSLLMIPLMVLVVVGFPLLPLLISRHWNWWEGWVNVLINVAGFTVSRLLAARRHPDLITERARFMQQQNTEPWDKWLVSLLGVIGVVLPTVIGLDIRFGWSAGFSLPAEIIALIVIIAGYLLESYALIENRFFSGTVRIQSDRGHHVVTTGPYRWIRHPGYAGGIISIVAMPIFLDSYWALLPSLIYVVIMVIRTRLEDKTLQDELPGYHDYTCQVRYRLLPGIW